MLLEGLVERSWTSVFTCVCHKVDDSPIVALYDNKVLAGG